ncbi:50S ribosomal protein L11 methyltransferase [uncultured Thiodictyon sp.]|uniref:50S ribosomal protein L11 methyltransferase n=1 Tax=uncultured Thiodictyon sp. TaxID=1846217 RepID=UPI0025DBC421|nr:50S ribosomal protein L11 methyltransferase [uncultured Thiodictyon sp.]
MSWLQLSLTVPQDQSPLLEAALENAGALAVTLGDAGDDPQLEPPPGAMPLWQAVQLHALFEDDAAGATQVEALTVAFGPLSLTPPRCERIADRAWERVWLEDFRPTRFGRRLWVCPQGQPAPDPDGIVVDLDPGLAFGTGHHPTTALCLEWLDGAELAGLTLLDYGCGSGILAIAALKLGAAAVIAVDHDPQAIEATLANAAANGVDGGLTVCLPGELATLAARLPVACVLANILAGPLVELATRLLAALAPGGQLVLSGVLAEQVSTVSAAYERQVELAPVRLREGWALIAGTRRAER